MGSQWKTAMGRHVRSCLTRGRTSFLPGKIFFIRGNEAKLAGLFPSVIRFEQGRTNPSKSPSDSCVADSRRSHGIKDIRSPDLGKWRLRDPPACLRDCSTVAKLDHLFPRDFFNNRANDSKLARLFLSVIRSLRHCGGIGAGGRAGPGGAPRRIRRLPGA